MAARVRSIQTAFVSTGDPATVNDTTPQNPLGAVYESQRSTTGLDPGVSPRIWQYVQLHSGSAAAGAGTYVIWQSFDNYVVTTASSTTSANRNLGAGFFQAVGTTAGNYGFIQIGGQGLVLLETATTGAVGQMIIQGATTAGRADSIALGTAATSGPYGVLTTVEIGTSDTYEAVINITCARLW